MYVDVRPMYRSVHLSNQGCTTFLNVRHWVSLCSGLWVLNFFYSARLIKRNNLILILIVMPLDWLKKLLYVSCLHHWLTDVQKCIKLDHFKVILTLSHFTHRSPRLGDRKHTTRWIKTYQTTNHEKS